MFNVCMCGAGAGYPHESDCPFPLYRASAAQEQRWLDAREVIREKQNNGPGTDDLSGESRYAHWDHTDLL